VARINVEDDLFKDQRFFELASKIGGVQNALGAIVWAFIVAQKHYKNEASDRLIPLSEWKRQLCSDYLIEAGLAIEKEKGVYVCGSDEQFSWITQRVEAGRKGGLAKGAKRQEIDTSSETKRDEAEAKRPLAEAKQTEASSLLFSTLLCSNKNTNTNTLVDESTLPVVSEKKEAKQNNFDGLMELFNSLHDAHGMPRIKVLTPERKRRIQKAQKAIGSDFEVWRKVFIISGTKGFIKADGSFWKPDFDYVFRNENYIKFSEVSQEGEEKTLGEKLRERFGDK